MHEIDKREALHQENLKLKAELADIEKDRLRVIEERSKAEKHWADAELESVGYREALAKIVAVCQGKLMCTVGAQMDADKMYTIARNALYFHKSGIRRDLSCEPDER